MNAIQGKAVPGYLGSVDLTSAFYLTTRTADVNLMHFPWASEEAYQCRVEPKRLWLETIRTHRQQGDLHPQNVLWSNELDRAILINFKYTHIEQAHNKIGSAIAIKPKLRRKSRFWVKQAVIGLLKLESKATTTLSVNCVT